MKWPREIIRSLVEAVGHRVSRRGKQQREALVFDLYVARTRAMRAEEEVRRLKDGAGPVGG